MGERKAPRPVDRSQVKPDPPPAPPPPKASGWIRADAFKEAVAIAKANPDLTVEQCIVAGEFWADRINGTGDKEPVGFLNDENVSQRLERF